MILYNLPSSFVGFDDYNDDDDDDDNNNKSTAISLLLFFTTFPTKLAISLIGLSTQI